jgi:hypothetical protein
LEAPTICLRDQVTPVTFAWMSTSCFAWRRRVTRAAEADQFDRLSDHARRKALGWSQVEIYALVSNDQNASCVFMVA